MDQHSSLEPTHMNNSKEKAAQEIITEWVNEYGDYLFQWAYHKTGNVNTSEDLVQESFLAAVKNYSKFKGNSSPKTWLVRILNNKIIDYYRKNAKKMLSIDDLEVQNAKQFTDSFFDSGDNWEANGLEGAWENENHLLDNPSFSQTMKVCIEDLPPKWRMAVLSKYIMEKEAILICQELNITKSNYWQVIHRSKLLLKKCLELKWFGVG